VREISINTELGEREKAETSGKTSGKTSGEMSGKTSEKILALIRENKEITIPERAELIGVTDRSIERNIKKLQEENKLKRIGPAKGGYWEILT